MAASKTHIDKALANRMVRGDERAFDEFFETYFSRLYRFTMARLGNDADAVEEVVQLTICRAVRKIGLYRGESALFTWLCRLCRNEISDHLKRTHRDAAVHTNLDDAEIRAALESLDAGDSSEPQREYRRSQLATLVRAVLDYLPPRQGDVLEWKYMQGYSVKEIAAKLEVSHAAAQSLLARARDSFRDGFKSITDADPDMVPGFTEE